MAPKVLPWPTQSNAHDFIHVYDWDQFELDESSYHRISTNLDLCTALFPCSISISGRGGGGTMHVESGSISCLANNGCKSVSLNSLNFECNSRTTNSLITIQRSTLTVFNSTFSHCSSSTDGGVVRSFNKAVVSISQSSFRNTTSGGYGGAISAVGSDLFISLSQFLNCTSARGGGAVWATLYVVYSQDTIGSNLKIDSSAFEGCKSQGNGGGLAISGYSVGATLFNSSLGWCETSLSGGAISVEQNAQITIQRASFFNNIAFGTGGGALAAQNASMTLIDVTCRYNLAAFGGGGALFWSGITQPRISLWCQIGHYSFPAPDVVPLNNSQECRSCSAGSFQSAEGTSSCIACGSGRFSSSRGYSSCLLCSPGTFYADSQVGATACNPCPVGTFSNESGSTYCMNCSLLNEGCTSTRDNVMTSLASLGGESRILVVHKDVDRGTEIEVNERRALFLLMDSHNPFCGQANEALYGQCIGSEFKSLYIQQALLAATANYNPGVPFSVVVHKKDFYNQTISADSTSILQAFSAAFNQESLQIDPTVSVLGATVVKFINGIARFYVSVKPTFLGAAPCRTFPALDHQPALFFQGVDSASQRLMQSSMLPVVLANCSNICPAGYILSLEQQSATGRSGVCTLCEPGSYSIDPLASGSDSILSDPSCINCPAGGDCSKGGANVIFAVGNWSASNGAFFLRHCPIGYQLINSLDGTSYGTFSSSSQRCSPCKQNQYLVHELEQCQQCPAGASCDGTTLIGDPGSHWRREGDKMRVYKCDPGYVMVRDDSNNQEKANLDMCSPCPAMYYSLLGAQIKAPDPCIPVRRGNVAYLCSQIDQTSIVSVDDFSLNGTWTRLARLAQSICLACPPGAICSGGASVIPNEDYWTESPGNVSSARRRALVSDRAVVYKCPPSACGPNNNCTEGRGGPVCGICLPGWAMSAGTCQQCPTDSGLYSAAKIAMGVAGSVALLILLYIFSLRPLFESDSDGKVEDAKDEAEGQAQDAVAENPEISSTDPQFHAEGVLDKISSLLKTATALAAKISHPMIQLLSKMKQAIRYAQVQVETFRSEIYVPSFSLGYIKVVLGFFQVLSTFSHNFSISWPPQLLEIFSGAAILSFNILAMPGPSCIAAQVDYKDKLVMYTAFPFLIICLLLIAPSIGWLFCPSKMERIKDSFWYSLMFFLFLIYPTCSVATFSSFSCQEIGSYGALLRSDLSEPCPYPYSQYSGLINVLSTTSFVFWWSFVCIFVYPLGIPIFFFVMMLIYKIPVLAKKKMDAKKVDVLIHEYRKKAMPLEVEILIRQLKIGGVVPTESALEQQIRLLFKCIARDNVNFKLKDFINFFKHPKLGLPDADEDTLQELFKAKDSSGDEALDVDEFVEMMQQIIHVQSMFTGHESLEDMHFEQLFRLYEFHKNQRLYFVQQESEQTKLEKETGWVSKLFSVIVHPPVQSSVRVHDSKELLSFSEIEHQGRFQYTNFSETEKYRKALSTKEFGFIEELLKIDLRTKILLLGDEKEANGVIAIPPIPWTTLDEGVDRAGCPQSLLDEDLAVRHMGFLMRNYDVKHWYFEITEMIRKLFMTSIVIFIYPGSSAQLAAALAFTILNIVHGLYAKPFLDHKVGDTQTYALVAQSLTILYGLMLADTENQLKLGVTVSYGQEAVTATIAALVLTMQVGIVVVPYLISAWKMLLAYIRKRQSKVKLESQKKTSSSRQSKGACRDSSLWNNSIIILPREDENSLQLEVTCL